jgi:hypothetical protein
MISSPLLTSTYERSLPEYGAHNDRLKTALGGSARTEH